MTRAGALIKRRVGHLAVEGTVDDAWDWLVRKTNSMFDEVTESAVLADMEKYENIVGDFIASLLTAGDDMRECTRLHQLVGTDEDYDGLKDFAGRYNSLVLGFTADAKADNPDLLPQPVEFGIAPLVVVAVAAGAGVVAVSCGLAAIAWAVVGRALAADLADWIALKRADLTAREAAAKGGYKLQDSTVDPPDGDDNSLVGWAAAGLFFTAVAGVIVYTLSQNGKQ